MAYEDQTWIAGARKKQIKRYLASATVSGDKKSITATVNIVGTVLVNIVQLVAPANGTTCYLTVMGD